MALIQKSMAVTTVGEELSLVTSDLPSPKGAQVLVKTMYCGLCHSDLHQIDGYFSLGGDDKLEFAGRKTPYCVGHEIVGEVIQAGPEAESRVKLGQVVAVYPWGGCKECPECACGKENICTSRKPKMDVGNGNNMTGGYSSHVLVPHYDYCFDATGLDPGFVATCMCSGLTAFAAIKKVGVPPDGARDILVLGLGGVGMQGLEFVNAMYGEMPLAADIRQEALDIAAAKGATVFNVSDKKVARNIRKATNGRGVFAVLDFVGTDQTNALATSLLRRGGSVIQIGLLGGKINMPLAMLTLKELAVRGTITGSLQECEEMFQLLRQDKVEKIPLSYRSISQVNEALKEMREGKLVGRVVLKHDWDESHL